MSARYIVRTHVDRVRMNAPETYSVYDTKKREYLCSCVDKDNALAINKAMNISDTWEPVQPILTRHEMGEGKRDN